MTVNFICEGMRVRFPTRSRCVWTARDVRHAGVLLIVALVACMTGCVARTVSPRWDAAELRPGVREGQPTMLADAVGARQGTPARPWPPEAEAVLATGDRATAGDAPPTDTSLVAILRTVAERNPMVEAARHRWAAATYRRPQVVALPDPKLEYRYFARQMARDEELWELDLSQEIPYPGKLHLSGKIADTEAEVAYVRYQIALRNAFAEAKELYFELYYIDRARQITADIEQLYTRYAALAVGGTDVAQPKLPERFRAESQRAQLGYDLVRLTEMRQAEMARLRTVVGAQRDWEMPPVPDLAEPPGTLPSFEALQAQAERYNQELAAASLEVERAQYQTQLARSAPVPDVMLSASYARTGDAGGGPDPTRDPVAVGIGVSVPLWTGKYRAMRHEAREAERGARAEREAQHLQNRADLARAYFSLQNTARLVSLYRDTLIPQARQALRSAEELYRQGQASLSAVLETTATVHNFELAGRRATADFYQNVTRIERILGTALPLQRSPASNASPAAPASAPAVHTRPRAEEE